MRRTSRAWVFAFVLLASTASAQIAQDAGTGADAGESISSATLLPSPSTYDGRLTVGDADWYAIEVPGRARCMVLDSNATVGTTTTLVVNGIAYHSIAAPTAPGVPTRLALAAPEVSRVTVGLQNQNGVEGTYGFTVTAQNVSMFGPGDANTGMDAPSTLFQGAPPVPGACLKGSVGLKDTADVFGFRALGGDQIVYSLARVGASSPTLALLDATGTALGGVISSGQVASVTVPATGNYYLSVSVPLDSGGADYLVGIVGPDPPPGNPCRPTCTVH